MASEEEPCAQSTRLDLPSGGIQGCPLVFTEKRSSGFCKMPQSPGGLLGQPFQEAQPCAGSQALLPSTPRGLLETEPQEGPQQPPASGP